MPQKATSAVSERPLGAKTAIILGAVLSALVIASGSGGAYARLCTRQDSIDERVTALEKRFDSINRKLDTMTSKLHDIDNTVTDTRAVMKEHLRLHGKDDSNGSPPAG